MNQTQDTRFMKNQRNKWDIASRETEQKPPPSPCRILATYFIGRTILVLNQQGGFILDLSSFF
ncbi:hypothetical protein DVUA0018 (plasmid) [Nitratidesulfovibrio vulgaris str. Hildenborough]|uniref:Uncharacterized protein n=1 Tax=Nitratidesulfovibrio vulgaris (strain ATCC 29579 / DSM 644 / CCUG 34227 / NCIMB 8303 / VKM B-1760 / Hildenborough) TaxID=882 RepID=Q72WS1_NITV2|nr:hypothetical protein DVUA0018 [Nitratidesulfovibrio vulgaris str. Hildenborough]